jgi:two-component system, NarL family, nitrate/nitrite response regulator NarL
MRVANNAQPADGARPLGLSTPSQHATNHTRTVSGRTQRRPPHLESLFARPGGDVTLVLIGGQRLLRDATASLLTREDDLRVLRTFESVAHYRAACMENSPAVLLLDCEESDPSNWQSAVSELCSPHAECSIVLLCSETREDVIRCAIEHGVNGIVLKSYTTKQIREAIAYVATGRTVMPAGWQQVLARAECRPLSLSPRQRQILALVAQGRGNEEIAAELGLSPNTVKFHIRALYSRLGVRNRVEAANQYAQMACGAG